ncbi:MAG: ribosome biogenesis GTPase Der [Puniceicoccales bacterium]|jgi:GTP-binding protein|nr:ribosome biogenesis GTPase Der [Puniceicoccales bacterium]
MKGNFCIAIVGRPNVGKSRLFNRLVGSRQAIVHDQVGVTRDILCGNLPNGVNLLDTGGIGLEKHDQHTPQCIAHAVEEQANFAIAMADLILVVFDGQCGITAIDLDIVAVLRKTGKSILPIVNKVDNDRMAGRIDEFFSLGLKEDPIAISAEHDRGIDQLMEKMERFTPRELGERSNDVPLSIAFIGAPNVGKSSIANALLKSPRMIVSDVAGTTRDNVSQKMTVTDQGGGQRTISIVDTAGLRAFGKMDSSVEYFSSVRARSALNGADVVFLLLDAGRGLTKYDKKIAQEVWDSGKSLAVIVNKLDAVEMAMMHGAMEGGDDLQDFRKNFEHGVHNSLFRWIALPVLFVSAKNGTHVEKIIPLAFQLHERAQQKIPTGPLNRFFSECIEKKSPSQRGSGKRAFKIFYALQTGTSPITIRIYCNQKKCLDSDYETYLRNCLIRQFQLHGCPLRIDLRERRTDQMG